MQVDAPGPRGARLSVAAIARTALVALTVLAAQSGWFVATARAADPVIAAAGDIACDPADSHFNGGVGTGTAGTSTDTCRQASVATTIEGIPGLQAVLDLGDNQYYCGSLQAFLGSYDKSWGAFKAITHPAVGNHEYLTAPGSSAATGCDATNAGASGHFTYFGAAAGQPGQGYYSFNLGSWHLIALNSNCSSAGGCSATSPQGKWLTADLAANTRSCTLAFWHIPLFSSGGRASANSKPLWASLYAAKADVVLNGHDHIYERFAPMTSTGTVDAVNGIREIIAGTGGANHTSIAAVAANSVVRDTTTFGALQLTLHAGSYDWQFLNSRGSFTDSGSAPCHRTPDGVAPTAPTQLNGVATSATSVALSWTGSTDNVGVAGYRVFRNGTQIGTSTTTSFTDTTATPATTATYSVAAFDGAGNQSTGNPTLDVTTPAAPPPTAPTKPGTPTAVTVTDTTATLTWTRSTDDVAVDHYTVARDGLLLPVSVPQPTFGDPQFTDTGLAPGTTYQYVVTAFDGDGNSTASSPGQVTTAAAAGAIGLVRQATGSSTSGTTLTVPIASTAGDALVAAIAVKAGGSITVSGVADSTGAAWTKGPIGFLTGSNTRIELWYRTGAAAVSSVTATLSSSVSVAADVSEWRGIAATGALDAQAGVGSAATTTPQTPAITATAPDLVIGALNWPGSATSTLTSAGFTSLADFGVSTTVNGRAAFLLPAGAGTFRAAWSLTTAFPAGTAILALKPA